MKTLILVFTLLATGCASQSPELTQYLLRADTADSIGERLPATTGIGQLTVSPYIDVQGLVVETSDGIVRTAHHHQWAEPLRDSLPDYLASEMFVISKKTINTHSDKESNWTLRIDIHINQLHGTADGNAKLEANWSVLDARDLSVLSENVFSDSEPLSSDGYNALFLAEKTLLRRLAGAITETLN